MLHVTRYLIPLALLLMTGMAAATAEGPVTIVTLGDSYINGYMIRDEADRFSAQVSAGLRARGKVVVFEDVGFKSTSLDALHWIQSPAGQSLLANPARHVLILETGQNDCLLFPLEQSRKNVDQILSALASSDIPVLVVGTVPYDSCSFAQWGAGYKEGFPAIFSELATKYGDLLYADFKAGIDGKADLLSRDHDHPNEAGEAIIAANILPSVEVLIDRVAERH